MSRENGTEKFRTIAEGPKDRQPIFFDPRLRRRKILRFSLFVVFFMAAFWLIFFGASLYLVEKLPVPHSSTNVSADDPAHVRLISEIPPVMNPQEADETRGSAGMSEVDGSCDVASRNLASDGGAEVFVYLPFWPEWTYVSLKRGCGAIDVVMPQWFRVDDFAVGIKPYEAEATHQELIRETLTKDFAATKTFPVIEFTEVAWPLSPGTIDFARLAQDIADLAQEQGYSGVCVNPGEVPEAFQPDFIGFLGVMDDVLTQAGRTSCAIVSGWSGLLDEEGLAATVDRVVWAGFELPWIGSAPGPLSSQRSFEADLRDAIARIGREKLVVGLGSFAFDWSSDSAMPEQIGFSEAMRRASRFGGRVTLAEDALNTRIEYTDDTGVRHEIWVLDAVSLYNHMTVVDELGLPAVAVWGLGTEDPTIWRLLGKPLPAAETAAADLGPVRLIDYVGYEGAGSFHRLIQNASPGTRLLRVDPETGLLVGQDYRPIPAPFTVERFGRTPADAVVLTFDDGPDPRNTPEILNILREKNAPATFFIVGRGMMKAPDLVRRMVDEGHEVGAHTFFHPRMQEISDLRVRLELNAFQRLLSSITGHETLLFRVPYASGDGPLIGPEVRPIRLVNELGYIVAGSEIIPPDWEELSPQQIVDHVRNRLDRFGGNVIMLHDGGGDRSATIEALPALIDMLRASGYRIVPLADLLGVDRNALMPSSEGAKSVMDRISFVALSVATNWMSGIFWAVIFLGAVRSIWMLVFAHLRGRHRQPAANYLPSVVVVIPAYNEENVILHCIETVLASDYPGLHVIVVDDGSKDHTYDRVLEVYSTDPRLHVITEPNEGKWKALDTAYRMVDAEIVVAIDADTLLRPDAIRKLVQPFADPGVGAVAGNVKVGNRGGLLTRLQALEYTIAQNIDRRAMELFNSMMVVPGAIGAWRADAVRAAGFYTNETVTEDADLTVAVIRAGYRVRFVEQAEAVTEVPETVRALMRQRLRWTFGMMQTGWKHRRAALPEKRAVGFLALPDLLIFGVLFSLLAPLADLLFLSAVFDYALDTLLQRPVAVRQDTTLLVLGYLMLPLLDLVTALAALRFQKDESLWLVLLIPLQRFFYRQLLYITAYRAVWRALSGQLAAWGKLVRLGNVRLTRT